MTNAREITTKAAVLYGPRELKIESWKLPPLRPGHVLIKVTSANICPTDVRKYWGYTRLPVPVVLGHEGAGIVERIIDENSDIREEDKVWIRPIIYWCGLCKYCKRGAINLCEKNGRARICWRICRSWCQVATRGDVRVILGVHYYTKACVDKITQEYFLRRGHIYRPIIMYHKSYGR